MYAVIRSGGKQQKVAIGQEIAVELLGKAVGEEVNFEPVLFVDGSKVHATASELSKVKVTGQVKGETKGPKIKARTYKPKSHSSKRWGHRQHYTTVEITKIAAG